MSAVHKEVHGQTTEQECERKIRRKMLPMINDQIYSGDEEKCGQNPPHPNRRRIVVLVHVVRYLFIRLELCIQTMYAPKTTEKISM